MNNSLDRDNLEGQVTNESHEIDFGDGEYFDTNFSSTPEKSDDTDTHEEVRKSTSEKIADTFHNTKDKVKEKWAAGAEGRQKFKTTIKNTSNNIKDTFSHAGEKIKNKKDTFVNEHSEDISEYADKAAYTAAGATAAMSMSNKEDASSYLTDAQTGSFDQKTYEKVYKKYGEKAAFHYDDRAKKHPEGKLRQWKKEWKNQNPSEKTKGKGFWKTTVAALSYLPKQIWKGSKAVGKGIGKGTKAIGKGIWKGVKAIPKQTVNLLSYAPRVAWSTTRYVLFDRINNGLNKQGLQKNWKIYRSKWKWGSNWKREESKKK